MARLTPAACVDGIAAVLESIDGIGQVHKLRRLVRTESDVRRVLFDEQRNRLCGWTIAPSPSNPMVTERHPGHLAIGVKGGGNNLTTWAWIIEGYFGVDDQADSEAAWRDLVWAVADEFNGYGLINVAGLMYQGPCQVEQFGFAIFAGAPLVHYARLGLDMQGRSRP